MKCELAVIVSNSPDIDRAHAFRNMIEINPLLVGVGWELLSQFSDELVARVPVLQELKGFHDAGVIYWESVHKRGRVLNVRKT